MLSNLLAVNPMSIVLMVVLFGLIIVWMVFSKRSQTKRQQETMDMLNAIKPGNKVKTIGGICGIVVEVCPEDNTFVLETGTEASGKSYIKFDKQAVYQTDAVVEKAAPVEEPKAEETGKAEETPAEEVFEEAQPAEETPAEEVSENKEETK
ncbi:MAG: preprotein translocase subunit YajC [Clostridia bacterium]|nr:preprotein translocase subunit YajC [Clostridia bacterium]